MPSLLAGPTLNTQSVTKLLLTIVAVFIYLICCNSSGSCSAPNSEFFKHLELTKTSRARKRILGLQVNIDKANSCRYDVTR